MYNSFQLATRYLQYKLTASNGRGHGIHSPFVFDFITKVLNDKTEYADYEKVELLRKKLLRDQTVIHVKDLGAGASESITDERKIATIAGRSLKPPKFGKLLYRMVKHYHPKTILELGTSLGITTSYLSLANSAANVITMEGAPSVAATAKQQFKSLNLGNIKLIEGDFDFTLPAALYHSPGIDFAFIDGNHRLEPTLDYFHQLLKKS